VRNCGGCFTFGSHHYEYILFPGVSPKSSHRRNGSPLDSWGAAGCGSSRSTIRMIYPSRKRWAIIEIRIPRRSIFSGCPPIRDLRPSDHVWEDEAYCDDAVNDAAAYQPQFHMMQVVFGECNAMCDYRSKTWYLTTLYRMTDPYVRYRTTSTVGMGSCDIAVAKPWIGGIEPELRWLLRLATFNWRVKLYSGDIISSYLHLCCCCVLVPSEWQYQ